MKHAEDKLLTLLSPAERQKILRLKSQASPLEISEAESDLSSWQNIILNTDKSLSKKQNDGNNENNENNGNGKNSKNGNGTSALDSKNKNLFDDAPTSTSTTKAKKLPPVRGGAENVPTSTHVNKNIDKISESSELQDVTYRLRVSGTCR